MGIAKSKADRDAEHALRRSIRRWMASHVGEVDSATELAERAAHEAEGGEDGWLDDPDHWIWEIAGEVKPA